MPGSPPPRADAVCRWEHFAHGSDIGIRGSGPSLAAALEQAGLALTAIVTDPALVRPETTVPLQCAAETADDLLYAWINALIFEMSVRSMVFGRLELALSGLRLDARLAGERIDRDRHQPAAEPKGATYTALAVGRGEDGAWVAQCVVDV